MNKEVWRKGFEPYTYEPIQLPYKGGDDGKLSQLYLSNFSGRITTVYYCLSRPVATSQSSSTRTHI